MKRLNLMWHSLPLLAALLLPTGLRAEEVGDEIVYERWAVNKETGKREFVSQTLTFTVTSADPSNRTVAFYKRKKGNPYDPEKVFEDELDSHNYAPALDYSERPEWGHHPDYSNQDEPFDVIDVPSRVMGKDGFTYTVTGIGSGAFDYQGLSDKLVIPSTVTEIGRYAIYAEYNKLYASTVTIPASVKRLHGNFVYGGGICNIVFERTDGDFQLDESTDNLFGLARGYVCTHAVVPQAVIDECKAGTRSDAFQQWYNECPSSIDPSQPLEAGCEFMVKVDDYLMNFTVIEAPDGQLEAALFSQNYSNIHINKTIEEVTYGVYNGRTAFSYHKFKREFKNTLPVSIPGSVVGPDGKTYTVTTIGSYACWSPEFHISTLTFPSTILHIGKKGGTSDAVTIDLSKAAGLKEIGDETFSTSENIEQLLLPANLETIGEKAFARAGDDGIGINLQLPVSLKFIGYSAFHAANLKSVNFKDLTNLKCISPYAFSYAPFADDCLEFAEGLERLSGFIYVKNVKSVKLPESLKAIDGSAFYESGLEEVTIPAGVDSIFMDAFAACQSLKKVTVEGARYIGRGAFKSCRALEEVNLPSVVNKIDDDAFNSCTSLTKLNFADLVNLKYVGGSAFYSCPFGGEFPALDSFEILLGGCFRKCGFTGTFKWPKNVKEYGSEVFAENDFTGEIVVPSRWLYEGYGLFNECHGITKVTFEAPEEYQDMNFESKFTNCSGVTDVYFVSAWPEMHFYLDEFAGPEKTKLHLSQWYIDYNKTYLATDPGVTIGGFLYWYQENPESLVPWDEAYLPKGFYCGYPNSALYHHIDLSPWMKEENFATWKIEVDDPVKRTLKVTSFAMPTLNASSSWLYSMIVVPDYLKMNNQIYTVTSIGESAFQGKEVVPDPVWPTVGPCGYNMIGLYLPSTVKEIERLAAYGNYNFQLVKFYEAGKKPFPSYIPDLYTSYSPNFVEYFNVTTADSPVMEPQMEVPGELEVIGEMAFDGGNPILTMDLPASLKQVEPNGLPAPNDLYFYNEEPDKLTWTDSGEDLASDMTIHVKQALYDQCANGQRTDLLQRYFDAGQVVLMSKNSGDVNGDGVIDEKDVNELSLAILLKPSYKYVSYAADVDGNGRIDMTDIVTLINKIKSLK